MAWTQTLPINKYQRIASWLGVVRALQALGACLAAGLNGALLGSLSKNDDLDILNSNWYALELMVSTQGPADIPRAHDSFDEQTCAALLYTGIVLLVLHCGIRRWRNPTTAMTATFVVCDTLCIGLMIAILTVLARWGFPDSCHRFREEGGAPLISTCH